MSVVIGRVTSGMTARAAQHHLQANLQRMSTLMERASGQRAILRPSDDPVGTGDSLRLRSEQRAAEQHARNTQDGLGWLTVADSAIRTSVDLLVRARDLALQGATGTASQQARDALAEEIDGIRDALLTEANASYNGRSVFAGTSDAGVAFSEDGTFQGVPGSSVVRRIGPDEQLRVDVDGAAVFGSGAGSVFAVLETLAADLRAGAPTCPARSPRSASAARRSSATCPRSGCGTTGWRRRRWRPSSGWAGSRRGSSRSRTSTSRG